MLDVLVLDASPNVLDLGGELRDAVKRRRKVASTTAPAVDLEGTYLELPAPRLVFSRRRDA